MFDKQRIATLAVVTAAAIGPALGAQTAHASPAPIAPVDLCVVKWVVPVGSLSSNSLTDDGTYPTTSNTSRQPPRDDFGTEIVEADDLSYNGC